MESHPITTSSTTSENNMNQIQEEKESKKRIEHPTFILSTNKKYKNLVHCYLCKIDDCQKLFKTNQELIEHRKTHTQLHICPMEGCGKSFKEIINLRKHYKHHFPTEKRYYCPFEGCGKSFTASYNLTIHYRIHIGKQPYKCQKCGKCFFDRANYKYHLTSKHININSKKLICQHKNCEHKSKSIKQKLMHHDKLEEICLQEKNLLINLVMFFQKSTFCLLNETDNKNEGNKNIVYNNLNENNLEDKKILNEIKKYNLDADLKDDFDKILIQSKVVSNNAINPDQYQDLI
jgi:uncharacterized Zn-finger protein